MCVKDRLLSISDSATPETFSVDGVPLSVTYHSEELFTASSLDTFPEEVGLDSGEVWTMKYKEHFFLEEGVWYADDLAELHGVYPGPKWKSVTAKVLSAANKE